MDDLPSAIKDHCQEYKRDTACFLYWLRRHALDAVGANDELDSELQVTGDKISTVALERCVDAIEAAGKACPRLYLDILRKAISGRTQVCRWYELNKPNHPENATHRGFINVLETILARLPCEEATTSLVKAVNVETESSLVVYQGANVNSANTYQSLFHHETASDLDESDTEYLSSAAAIQAFVTEVEDASITATTTGTSTTHMSVEAEFQLECEDKNWKAAADLYAFFESIQQFRDNLKTLWQSYEDGEVDLTTAAITTNVVLHRVRREEKELLQAHQTLNKDPTYAHLATTVFYTELRKRSGRDIEEYTTSPSTFNGHAHGLLDLVLMPTAHTIAKFNSVSSQPMPGASSGKKKKKRSLRPILPVPDLNAFYMARPDLSAHPEMPRWSHEDRLLSQLLMELRMLERMAPETMPDFRDEFSRSIRMLWEEGGSKNDLDVYTVFCSRVMLDILAICGISGSYHEDLAIIGHDTRRLIDGKTSAAEDHGALIQLVKHTSHDTVSTFKRQHVETNAARLLTWSGSESPDAVALNSLRTAHTEMTALGLDLGGLDRPLDFEQGDASSTDDASSPQSSTASPTNSPPINLIHLSPELDFAVTQHPLHCGNLALTIVLEREARGIEFANASLSIFLVSYLYTALREHKVLTTSWPELERVMSVQKAAIFGEDPPSNPGRLERCMLQRSLLSMKGGKIPAPLRERWKLQRSPVSQVLQGLLESRESADVCLEKIEEELRKYTTSNPSRKRAAALIDDGGGELLPPPDSPEIPTRQTSISGKGRKGKRQQQRQQQQQRRPSFERLTPEELVDGLTEFVPSLMSTIMFDYVSLSRHCSALLKRLLESHHLRSLFTQSGLYWTGMDWRGIPEYTVFWERFNGNPMEGKPAERTGVEQWFSFGLVRLVLQGMEKAGERGRGRMSDVAVEVGKEVEKFLGEIIEKEPGGLKLMGLAEEADVS